MKHSVRLVSVVVILATLLSACAPPAAQVVEKEVIVTQVVEQVVTQVVEKKVEVQVTAVPAVKLSMMCWNGMVATREIVEGTLIPGFQNQNPNITIKYEEMPWPEYWTSIAARAAAGTMPDLYCNSVAYAWDHANKNMSANLQPLIDRDLKADDYFMEITPVNRYPDKNGDIYSFPIRWVDGTLFYNKKLFDEAGVAYPTNDWTYEDVLVAAKQLTKDTDNDGKTDQYGLMAGMNHIALDAYIKSNGGQVLNDSYSKCMLTEEKALAGIQWMSDLVLKHKVSPSPETVAGFAVGMFQSGKLAMQIDGSYMTKNYTEIKDFEWDVAMQPQGAEGRVIYGGPDQLAISKTSDHPEEAWAMLKYIIGPEQQGSGDMIGLGSMPFLKSAAASESWIKAVGQPGNAQSFADSFKYIQGADFGSQWMEWRIAAMNSELDQVVLGTRSVEESAAAACTAIDAILAKIAKP